MTAPHRITEQFIAHGISPVAARLALRTAATLMKDDGAGTTAGIHDFGVFYVRETTERFVIREDKVFKVPSAKVLKLRPSKQAPVELAESDDVRLELVVQNESGSPLWSWKSTSRAGRFEVVTPVAKAGDDYDFVRFPTSKGSTYVMCKDSVSDGDCSGTTGFDYDSTNDEVVRFRFAHSLLASHEWDDGSFAWGPRSIKWQAEVAAGPLEDLTDPVNGREVAAWCRQRAIDLEDR